MLLLLLFLLLVLLLQRNRAPQCSFFLHHNAATWQQCCSIFLSFPFLSLFFLQHNGASMATQCRLSLLIHLEWAPQCCLLCITMRQPGNNAVRFSSPVLLYSVCGNGACMATQCWHPLLSHSNNAAICATHCYAWEHNDHLKSHSHLNKRCGRACVWPDGE